MEKKERKETAKERKRKWSVVVVTGERKGSVQGTREDEIFMNGSMHSKVLKSIVSLKWFIEEKFIFSMSPHENFFFPFISPRDGICKGWTRGMHKHPITPAALLGQEGAVGGKCGCQKCVTAESVRSGVGATAATQVEDQAVGKLLLGADNLTHCPGVLLLSALLFDCLLLRVTETEEGARVCFLELLCVEMREQLVRQVQIWGFEDQGSFSPAFGLCNQKERMDKACLDWEGNDPDHCTHLRYLDELNQTSQMPDLLLLL